MPENQPLPAVKLPKRVAVYFALTFVATMLNSLFTLEYFKVLTFSEIFTIFLRPLPLILALILAAVLTAFYKIASKKIHAYDGSEESAKKTNRILKIFEMGTIGGAVINGPLFAFIILCCAKAVQIELPATPVYLVCIASVGLFACFFYICFMQNFEWAVYAVTFSEENLSLSLLLRTLLVNFFSLLGQIGRAHV